MRPLEWHDLNWCLRRAPRDLLELAKRHDSQIMIAGGFVRSCIANERVSDADVFSPTKDMAELFAKEFAGGGKVISTGNAFTVPRKARFPVQFIHRWAYPAVVPGVPERTVLDAAAVLSSFDFSVSCAGFWWDGKGWRSLCHERFYADLAGRRLCYLAPARNEDAGGSMLRVLKFYQRGYRIPIDSLGAVIARLANGVLLASLPKQGSAEFEPRMAAVITGLLREVDPALDPSHVAHLPAESTRDTETEEATEVSP